MKKCMIVVLISTFLCGCFDKIELRNIKILNESESDIYCLISNDDFIKTRYSGYNEFDIFEKRFKIERDSLKNVYDKPREWDSFIRRSEGEKMRLFIIAKDSVDKYGWETIFNNNVYTIVYKFDMQELNSLKWNIIYNGL